MADNAAHDIEPRRLDPELAGLEEEHGEDIDTSGHETTDHDDIKVPEQPQQQPQQQQKPMEDIDLLIEQLDQIESEYSAKLSATQATLHEKDAIISALGRNLRELKDVNTVLENELKQERDSVQLLQDELVKANEKLSGAREEMKKLSRDHEMILTEEVKRLEAKASAIEKDVCDAAEEQFAQAKRAYDALLRERDELMLERDALARELQMARLESSELEARSRSKEADSLARIAELKAEIASSRAQTISVKRDYKVELDEAQRRIHGLEESLHLSNDNRAATERASALAQTNRERLEKENAELSILCDELMSIVEGHGEVMPITSS